MAQRPTASQLTAFRRDRDVREWSREQEELAAVERRALVERSYAVACAADEAASAGQGERDNALAQEFADKLSALIEEYRERLRTAGADAHQAALNREDALEAVRVEYPDTPMSWPRIPRTFTPPVFRLVDPLRWTADRIEREGQ